MPTNCPREQGKSIYVNRVRVFVGRNSSKVDKDGWRQGRDPNLEETEKTQRAEDAEGFGTHRTGEAAKG